MGSWFGVLGCYWKLGTGNWELAAEPRVVLSYKRPSLVFFLSSS